LQRGPRRSPGGIPGAFIGPHFEGEPTWLKYLIGLGLLTCTAYLRNQLSPILGIHSPLLPFVLPVLATALLSGRGPAFVVTVLSPILCTLLFQKQFTWSDPVGWLAHVAFFLVIAGVTVQLLHQLQEAHRRLVQSEARLRLAVRSAEAGIFEWRMKERRAIWDNDRMYEIFGRTREDGPISDPATFLAEHVHPEDAARITHAVEGCDKPGHHCHLRARVRHQPDGQWRHVEMLAMTDLLPDGELRLVGVVRDLTARHTAQQALARSERRFQHMADALPDIVFVIDQDRKLHYLNKRWQEYTGRTTAEWKDLVELIPDVDLERMEQAWREYEPRAQGYSVEFRLRNRKGELRWFLRRSVPVLNAQGEVELWIGTSTDIHEQKLAQTALTEADRRKNEFLAMLAHELRNPLAPIVNIASILQSKAGDLTAVHQMSDILRRQTSHLARLVDDLLDVARVTRDKIQLHKEPLILRTAVDRALEGVHPLLIARSQAVKLVNAPRPITIAGDLVRLTQAIGNLLTNASKFSPDGATIFVTIEENLGEARVRVRDQGVGIDGQVLPLIFDLFMQADQSLDRAQGGLGIGLTVAKRLVELHGGRIEARSDGPGRGSEFMIALPLAPGSSQDAGPDTSSRAVARRVLIVDDNIDAAISLLMLLEMEGHEVRAVHDGSSALRELEKFAADVVLLDIGLPGMDGYAVAELIRQQAQGQAPILVALSGYAPDESGAMSDARFDAHLTKPVHLPRLLEILASQAVA
jgi:PAS domain S-box-containing protein